MAYWERRDAVQDFLARQGWRGWLLMDFRGSNPLLWQVLGRGPEGGHLTRRTFLWIPAGEGEIVALPHDIERGALVDPRWTTRSYTGGASLREALAALGIGGGRGPWPWSTPPWGSCPTSPAWTGAPSTWCAPWARRWSPRPTCCSWPSPSGTSARWRSTTAPRSWWIEVKDEAFAFVGERLRAGAAVDEHEVAEGITAGFAARGLTSVYSPTVAAGPNSANPHYEPLAGRSRPIGRDEWLLIDLWARLDEPGSPFADVTWVAWTGPAPVPQRVREVFEVVRQGRDLALERLAGAAAEGTAPQGWEIDRAVRDYIAGAGFGPYFTHRTGHNLGPEELHGSAGVCLDDFETHDTRRVLPGVAFSVEPGIYLPADFGVRLELNAVMTESGPRVYTPVQREIITLT